MEIVLIILYTNMSNYDITEARIQAAIAAKKWLVYCMDKEQEDSIKAVNKCLVYSMDKKHVDARIQAIRAAKKWLETTKNQRHSTNNYYLSKIEKI